MYGHANHYIVWEDGTDPARLDEIRQETRACHNLIVERRLFLPPDLFRTLLAFRYKLSLFIIDFSGTAHRAVEDRLSDEEKRRDWRSTIEFKFTEQLAPEFDNIHAEMQNY